MESSSAQYWSRYSTGWLRRGVGEFGMQLQALRTHSLWTVLSLVWAAVLASQQQQVCVWRWGFCYTDPHLLFAFTQVAFLPPSFHSGPGHLPCHLPGTGQALQVSPSLVSSPVYGPEAKSWARGPL